MHQQTRLRIHQDALQLGSSQPEIQRHGDCAEACASKEQCDLQRVVEAHPSHALTTLNALAQQSRRDGLHLHRQLRVARLLPLEAQRRRMAAQLSLNAQDMPKRRGLHLPNLTAHPLLLCTTGAK